MFSFFGSIFPKAFNILNISPVLSIFVGGGHQTFNIFNISPVSNRFCEKKKTFNISSVSWTHVHETGDMLNVFAKQA